MDNVDRAIQLLESPSWMPINLTPHPIVYVVEKTDGSFETLATIDPEGTLARVSVKTEVLDNETSSYPFQAVKQEMGEITGVPTIEENTPQDVGFCDQRALYIVSRMVFDALPKREDIVAPDTGPTAYRDPKGRILGVTQFVCK